MKDKRGTLPRLKEIHDTTKCICDPRLDCRLIKNILRTVSEIDEICGLDGSMVSVLTP